MIFLLVLAYLAGVLTVIVFDLFNPSAPAKVEAGVRSAVTDFEKIEAALRSHTKPPNKP